MDSHTLLANKVLNMVSEAGEGWPTTMQKYGYAVRAIEMSVRVGGRNVSPDIVLTSDRHGHAMVIDCKSGANVDLRQDRLYSQMAIGDLWRAGVPRAIRLHTPIYAINNEHVDRISGHTDQALMVFGRRTIFGIGDFGNAELTRELRAGIRLKIGAMPDTDVCPFSIRDAHGTLTGAWRGQWRGTSATAPARRASRLPPAPSRTRSCYMRTRSTGFSPARTGRSLGARRFRASRA